MPRKRKKVEKPLHDNIGFEEFQSREILASTKISPGITESQIKHVLEPSNTILSKVVIRRPANIPDQFSSPKWSSQITQANILTFTAPENIPKQFPLSKSYSQIIHSSTLPTTPENIPKQFLSPKWSPQIVQGSSLQFTNPESNQTSPLQSSNDSLFPKSMTQSGLNIAHLEDPELMITRLDDDKPFSESSNKKKRKRKKIITKEDNRLGYKENHEIFFVWMLYNCNFWECVPETHILNRAVNISPEKHTRLLVENLLKSKTGVELEQITAETLLSLPKFTALLTDLVKYWKRLSLSHLVEAHCAKKVVEKNAKYYAIDKCIFSMEQVELLMNIVPATEHTFFNINNRITNDDVGAATSSSFEPYLSNNVHDSQYLKQFKLKGTLFNVSKNVKSGVEINVDTSLTKDTDNNISSMEKTLQDFEILSETVELVNPDKDKANSVTALNGNRVHGLIKSVMRRVIPIELVGSRKNFRLLERAVKILMLCGRHDKIYIGHLMKSIRISDVKWAFKLKTFYHRSYVISKLWVWLLHIIVMAVLRSFFYITESSVTRNQLLYYRKREWQKKHDEALAHLVSNGALLHLSRDAVRQLSLTINQPEKNITLKMPRLRFLPKENGVRPILPTRLFGMNASVKKHAKILLNYLSEKSKSGSIRINAAKGMHKAWQSYIRTLKNDKENKSLYFVRVDVKDAYGSILHSQLMKILQEIVAHLPPIMIFGQYKSIKQDLKFYKISYIALDSNGSPTQSLTTSNGLPLVQCGLPIHIKTQEIIRAIWYSVKQQIVKCGTRHNFLLIRGISQGGMLSSALCELYYSSLCSTHLADFNVFPSMLLRSVDDMLFVTPDLKKARFFLQKMDAGFPDFNCKINNYKTAHNIDSGEGIRVSFCGVVVCSTSYQLLVNISSLAQGLPRYSVKLNSYKHPGKLLADRLRQVTLARLNASVLDPVYTTTQGLICNIWRAGVMAGARFLALVGALLAPHGPVNTGFLASVIVEVGGKVWRRVKSIWGSVNVMLPVPQAVVKAIYIGAIYKILTQPHMPVWPGISRALKYYLCKLFVIIPQRFYCMIPLSNSFKKHFNVI